LALSLPSTLEGSKNHNSTKTLHRPKNSLKFCPGSLLSTTGKLFENLILRTIQTYTEERNLLNASQFGFRAHHSTTLQCMRLMNHVTLSFNNMLMATVFLDMEKAFGIMWHSGLLYKISLECL
jgi:hypothetical protein